jgi:hypothetical protein
MSKWGKVMVLLALSGAAIADDQHLVVNKLGPAETREFDVQNCHFRMRTHEGTIVEDVAGKKVEHAFYVSLTDSSCKPRSGALSVTYTGRNEDMWVDLPAVDADRLIEGLRKAEALHPVTVHLKKIGDPVRTEGRVSLQAKLAEIRAVAGEPTLE